MRHPRWHKLDPPPSPWLLELKYGNAKQLTTRKRATPFTLQWRGKALQVTTSTGSSYELSMEELREEWQRVAHDRRLPASRIGRFGSYVRSVYSDLHAAIGVEPQLRGEWRVYVVELAEEAWNDRGLQQANPGREFDKPCLYVGCTSKSLRQRYLQHRRGHKASHFVRDYGLRLLPELYERIPSLPSEDLAVQAEQGLAAALRTQGFGVDAGAPRTLREGLSTVRLRSTRSRGRRRGAQGDGP